MSADRVNPVYKTNRDVLHTLNKRQYLAEKQIYHAISVIPPRTCWCQNYLIFRIRDLKRQHEQCLTARKAIHAPRVAVLI